MKARLEDVILGQGSARSELMLRRTERAPSSPVDGPDRLRWRKEQRLYKPAAEGDPFLRAQAETDAGVEGSLATETTLIVVDTLEMVVSSLVRKIEHYISEQKKIFLH